jgi:hypothetical protein
MDDDPIFRIFCAISVIQLANMILIRAEYKMWKVTSLCFLLSYASMIALAGKFTDLDQLLNAFVYGFIPLLMFITPATLVTTLLGLFLRELTRNRASRK